MRKQYKFLIILSLVFVFAGSIVASKQSWASRLDAREPESRNLDVRLDFADLADTSEVGIVGYNFGDKDSEEKQLASRKPGKRRAKNKGRGKAGRRARKERKKGRR